MFYFVMFILWFFIACLAIYLFFIGVCFLLATVIGAVCYVADKLYKKSKLAKSFVNGYKLVIRNIINFIKRLMVV